MAELVYAAAERHPDLLPTRAAIDAERELLQKDKQGLEIDQGVFLAHVLAHPRLRPAPLHAMAQPKAEALDLARRAAAHRQRRPRRRARRPRRRGRAHHDAEPRVPELRGRPVGRRARDGGRPRAARRRDRGRACCAARRDPPEVRRAADLRLGPEPHAPLLREDLARRVHARARARRAVEDVPRPRPRRPGARVGRVARGPPREAVRRRRRVLRDRRLVPDPARAGPRDRRGRVVLQPARRARRASCPGCANLRLPRFVGERPTRQAIFFNRDFPADSPEGRMLADEVARRGRDRRGDRARGRRSS